MQERIRDAACRNTTVCVDSYERRIPSGRFYSGNLQDEGRSFEGLVQLLTGIEQALDSANYPQSFTAIRKFSPLSELQAYTTPDSVLRRGQLATFSVKILFRQHTSWQGSVTWLEAQSEQPFRSVLELIMLMDSALNNQTE